MDAGSGIFSFGSLLYEMVTGQKAFRGDSKVSTLAAILAQEPATPEQSLLRSSGLNTTRMSARHPAIRLP